MSLRRAIVTLAIGEPFRRRWQQICRRNWQAYADRHGYELICVDQPLDTGARATARSPAWQKCLILSQPFSREYDRLVWVDLDIVMHPLAPDVCDGVPIEAVGCVDEYGIPTPELHRRMLAKNYARWTARNVPFIHNPTAEDYYTAYGFAGGFARVPQTGVMVLSPTHHRALLEAVYTGYEDRGAGWNYEMRPLAYELMRADCVSWLDPRFNYIWGIYESLHCPHLADAPDSADVAAYVRDACRTAYFVHFAGSTQHMRVAASADLSAPPPPSARRSVAATAGRRSAATDLALCNTPVALFIFNRPQNTAAVFEVIRRVQPPTLLVVADGPRPTQDGDVDACAAARAVVERIDWPCEVRRDYADTNLGLKRRVDSGMQWIFSRCEQAILLEDDCLPEVSFFRFCEEMLDRYRDDGRVLSISGNNFQFGRRRGSASYYFSRYGHIWGWATWRRAWALYDPEMRDWPAARREGWLERTFTSRAARQYWAYIFESNYRTQETWDYAWNFSYWRHGGVHVLPNVNLVSNHGFGAQATHTRQTDSTFGFLLTEPMAFPLRHPGAVTVDGEADAFTEEIMYSGTLTRAFERVRAHPRRAQQR